MVGVLDLGFGQRGAVVDAPVDRLQPLVDQTLFEERIEVLDDLGLVVFGHGGVGVFKVAKDSNALELVALDLQVLFGVLAAGVANLKRVHLKLLATESFIYFDFDRQPVTVPAWDVR